MRAFSDPLAPALHEVGVDRIQITVKGVWRARDAGAEQEYRACLTTTDPIIDWFKTPAIGTQIVTLETLKQQRSTIGRCKMTVDGMGRQGGGIRVSYTCNPTRTLTHLLAAHPGVEDFAQHMERLDEAEFFARADGVPASLDGEDNWIVDYDEARARLGQDIFATFLPIFVRQLQRLTIRLLAPYDEGTLIGSEGAAMTAAAPRCNVRLEWGIAAAPQVETYFERFHGQARSIVRSAAQTVLSALDVASVRHHLNGTSFERSGDLFSMVCELPGGRSLAIYAKSLDRLRFEVRRFGGARYPGQIADRPETRLLTILSAERNGLLHACQWRMVGELLAEHGVPVMGDLIALLNGVVDACAAVGEDSRPIFAALLCDAGLQRTPNNGALVQALQRRGVLQRVTLRQRNGPLPHRYVLTPDFRAAYEGVLSAFSGSEPT